MPRAKTVKPKKLVRSTDRDLHEAVRALTSELSLDAVLQKVADLSRRLVGANFAALGVTNDQGELEQFITSGISKQTQRKIGSLPQGLGVLGYVLREGKPLRLLDVSQHPSSIGFPQHHPKMKAFMGVPVMLKGHVIGDLYLANEEGGDEFTQEDETLVTIFANQAAVAIENARLFQREHEALVQAEQAVIQRRNAEDALRESEKQLRDVLDNTSAVLYIKDTLGRYLFINRQYENVFHVRRDQIQGKTDYDVFSKEIADVLRANDQRVLESGAHLELEENFPHDDGLHTYISAKYILRNSTGVPYAVYGISTDITDQKRVQHYLAVAEERERIGRDLHDGVIQSIYAVGLDLEDLADQVTADPQSATGRINGALDDLNQVIRDIRSYIMDLRPRELQGRPFDLAVDSLIEYLRERTGVRVYFKSYFDLAALGERYVVNLWHIFQEAFSNVEKYARATRLDISLNISGGNLDLEIQDDGVGFDLEQAEASRGFGLSNIKDRSERMGGMLHVVTAPGKGTRLSITIPYRGLSA